MARNRSDGYQPFTQYGIARFHAQLKDTTWLERQLQASITRFLIVQDDKHLVVEGGAPEPVLLTADDAGDLIPQAESVTLLGQMNGNTYVALGFDHHTHSAPASITERGGFRNLRYIAPLLEHRIGGLLAYAQAMVYWHHRHRFCGVCGHPMESIHGGHLRVCTHSECRATQFPRTDPAIIVLVTHEGRCLLARQPHWPEKRYSIIAGFVEPGESLEDAVAREVQEETGVLLRSMTYQASQPWPFPKSLMVGFFAQAAEPHIHRNDGELEDARWLSRDALKTALEQGDVVLPSAISISRRLITQWFNAGTLGPLDSVRQIVW